MTCPGLSAEASTGVSWGESESARSVLQGADRVLRRDRPRPLLVLWSGASAVAIPTGATGSSPVDSAGGGTLGSSDGAVRSLDDVVLLARLREGDDAAFGELYRRHAPMVRRFALSMQRAGIDVDDVVAEVFLRVLRAVRSGRGPRDAVRTYLFTVVRRVLAEWVAARRDEPMTSDELGEHVPRQGDHQVVQAEGELLARAFLRLPARWREVLWRTEVEGHRPASIARQLGLTPNATAVLAHRARRGLREAYHQASDLPVAAPGCLRRA